jgi:tRNA (guanine37-N1)-methyltransferase
MRLEILTIFPEIFSGFIQSSLVKKAIERDLVKINLVNIRDFASPPHYHVDDTPYGGGAGMLMKPEPLSAAIEDSKKRLPSGRTILLTPSGQPFRQEKAEELSTTEEIILICGRYEGVDQRVIDLFVDEQISIGDYVLMGGEVPAMAVVEAIARLKDNVLGNSDSIKHDSFSREVGLPRVLEAPHYTRPPVFRGHPVPEVLLSGDHKKIEEWRRRESLARTRLYRPDLLDQPDE